LSQDWRLNYSQEIYDREREDKNNESISIYLVYNFYNRTVFYLVGASHGGASGFEVVICVISIVILGSTVSHFAKVYFWLPRQLRQLEKEYSKEELLQLQDEAQKMGVISSPVFSDSGDGSSDSLYEDLKEVKGCGAVTARKIVNKIDNSQTLTNREEELLKKAGWEVE
jgi:hypothetical protein